MRMSISKLNWLYCVPLGNDNSFKIPPTAELSPTYSVRCFHNSYTNVAVISFGKVTSFFGLLINPTVTQATATIAIIDTQTTGVLYFITFFTLSFVSPSPMGQEGSQRLIFYLFLLLIPLYSVT